MIYISSLNTPGFILKYFQKLFVLDSSRCLGHSFTHTLGFDHLSLQTTSVDNEITTTPLLYSFMFTVVRKFGALFFI